MSDERLWPCDGFKYDIAMMEAEKEYKDWLYNRKLNRGITIYSNKKQTKEAQ